MTKVMKRIKDLALSEPLQILDPNNLLPPNACIQNMNMKMQLNFIFALSDRFV